MSRVGKLPVLIPSGVEVDVKGLLVSVSGPLGQIKKEFRGNIDVNVNDSQVLVSPKLDAKLDSMWGTARSIISNMVQGVSKGFEKELEITGVGYRASVKDNYITLSLGKSHGTKVKIPELITVSLPEKKDNLILLKSIDKELLGKFAALLISLRPTEPYKGKGIKIKGQFVLRKEGKKT